MVNVSIPNGQTKVVEPPQNGDKLNQIFELVQKLKADNDALRTELAEVKAQKPTTPQKSGLEALTPADFKRAAKPIVIKAGSVPHLQSDVTLEPSINDNKTWMWGFEGGTRASKVDCFVEIDGQIVSAVVSFKIYVSGSKDRK